MKNAIHVTIAVAMLACGEVSMPAPPQTSTSSGVGGSGGTSSTSGAGGSDTAARPCVDSGDCDGRNGVPTCNVDVCVSGFCQVVFDAFGVLCGDPGDSLICDGKGQCGEWMPADATSCYEPSKLPPSCPLCDDADPATHDTCETDAMTGGKSCTNVVASDGFVCGPNHIVSGGKCCPASN